MSWMRGWRRFADDHTLDARWILERLRGGMI